LKTVILAPDCDLSDEALMIENETIANPTNKKIKTEPSPKKQEQPTQFLVNGDMIIDDT